MKNSNRVLIVDFDNTLVNSSETILRMLYWKNRHKTNNTFGYNPNILKWDFTPYAKTEEDTNFCKAQFNNQRFYDELEPMKGALEVLRELHKNYRIVICSNRNVENIEMFVTTVRNLFGDVVDDIIPIIDSFDKSIIKADIRIDDKIECMMNDYSSFNILFGDYGYNKNCDEDDFDCRVFSWNEVLNAVREFEEWN